MNCAGFRRTSSGLWRQKYRSHPFPSASRTAWLMHAATSRTRRYRSSCVRQSKNQSLKPISPIAYEAVKQLEALFEIERRIAGKTQEERLVVRQQESLPLMIHVRSLSATTLDLPARRSCKCYDYLLKRWDGFLLFLHGRSVSPTSVMRGHLVMPWLFSSILLGMGSDYPS